MAMLQERFPMFILCVPPELQEHQFRHHLPVSTWIYYTENVAFNSIGRCPEEQIGFVLVIMRIVGRRKVIPISDIVYFQFRNRPLMVPLIQKATWFKMRAIKFSN